MCDLLYENNFKDNYSNGKMKRKITIEENPKIESINTVSLNLFEFDLEKTKVNIELNFIDVNSIMKKINNLKGWVDYFELNLNNMLLIGIQNNI